MTAGEVEAGLIGTWRLLSYELRNPDGSSIYPMSERAQGRIIYDRAGNMSVHLNHPEPPAISTAPAGMSEEMRISYECYTGYYGHYTVDLADRRIDHHLAGASLTAWVNTTLSRNYVLEGDRLTLSAVIPHSGQCAILKWERIG